MLEVSVSGGKVRLLLVVLALFVCVSMTFAAANPVLLVGSGSNPFTFYYSEILQAEGINAFDTIDISALTASTLSGYDLVVLGEVPLTASQVAIITNWVNLGGNLIAMRPDKQLAGLLGLADAALTLSNAYLAVNTSSQPGIGIVAQPIQFHGTADLYTAVGATTVATLYSNISSSTPYPAVTLRTGIGSGGKAAAFTYDLARSVVYTRQGNPLWAGQHRDGNAFTRPDDMFFGNASFDPQPDWVNKTNIGIPQSDEQQRLLANLVLYVNLNKKPLPRFWYFPFAYKSAVIMTGDDHAKGGTAGRFDDYIASSATGCFVANWQCIRATSYVYPNSPLTDSQAANYTAQGFEVALHPTTNCTDYTFSSLDTAFTSQISAWSKSYPSIPLPSTNRTHCVVWSDWFSQPQVELGHGIRLDTTYYHWPGSWIGLTPGFMTGSGMPMRFANTDGTVLDVYQAPTQMTDESGQVYPGNIDFLLDNATGSAGFYGAFVASMHNDLNGNNSQLWADQIVASAKRHGVPVVSSKQMLLWLDGRNRSAFTGISWATNSLTFTLSPAIGSTGLGVMVPAVSAAGALSAITSGGSPVSYTLQTIKGISYAFFLATGGTYVASYAPDTTPPVITAVAATVGPDGTATISWTTNESSTSRVDYGTSPSVLGLSVTNPLPVTSHSVTLTGLALGSTYYYRVTSVDAFNNSASAPASPNVFVENASRIWTASQTPAVIDSNNGNAAELGLKFRSDIAGFAAGVMFYKGIANTGIHVGNLWSAAGTLLATVTFTNETTSGWQQANFSSPVPINANTTYVISYHTAVGHFSDDSGYFSSSGFDNAPLHALSNSAAPGNGVYLLGAGGFPNLTNNSDNYWVDVVFQPPEPKITAVAATPASTTTTITWITDEPATSRVDYGASSASLTLNVSNSTLVISHSLALAGLTPSSTYYYRVASVDSAGNTTIFPPTLSAPATFTTTDNTPPVISAVTATDGQIGTAIVAWTTNKPSNSRVDFGIAAASLTLNVTDATMVTSHSVTLNGLTQGTTYYYRVTSTDAGGNSSTSPPASSPPATFTAVVLNRIWTASTTPAIVDAGDSNAVEVGLKFRSDTAGLVKGVLFYKSAANTGIHVGNLWSATGSLLATVTFTSETASGWQQANFSTPAAINANTTYVISYHTVVGHYSYTSGYFSSSGFDNAPLHALSNAAAAGNAVYSYGTGGFPTATYGSANYWVDLVFQPSEPLITAVAATAASTTATISWITDEPATSRVDYGVSPASLTLNVANSTLVTSHSLALTSLTPSTTYYYRVTSVDAGSNTTVSPLAANPPATFATINNTPPVISTVTATAGMSGTAVVTWSTDKPSNSRVDFGTASASLTLNATDATLITSHSITLGGLTSGVTYYYRVTSVDAGGNSSTSPPAASPPSSFLETTVGRIWTASTTPAIIDSGDSNAAEVGLKFRSDVAGTVTGVMFYKSVANTGIHVGNLWSSTGSLLATVTFTGETASGWQQANFSTPIPINANTTYIISYHTALGHYSYNGGYFSSSGFDNAPLHALSNAAAAGNGVYVYGAGGFPNLTFNSNNYWVDVIFH